MTQSAREPASTTDTINETIVFLLTFTVMVCGVIAALGARNSLVAISIVLFGSFIAVFAHELGHAIAAWLVGWRVWIIHVAPLALRLDGGALRLDGGYDSPDFAGFVLASPTAPRHDTKWRAAFVSAGGPLASWIMAVVFILIAWPGSLDRYEIEDLRYALYALGLFSLATAIGTTLPLHRGRRVNDAAKIQATLDGSMKRPPHAAWAQALWLYGVEPKHWNADLRASVDAARTNPSLAWMPAYFEFIAALRANDAAAARATFSAFGAEFNDATLSVLEAFVRATMEGDADGARAILNGVASLEGVPPEVISLRELALVDIDRALGQTHIARNRLARVHGQVTKSAYRKQPYWAELFRAAEKRLSKR